MENKFNVTDLLEYIDPTTCSYEEWLNVGLALHQEGFSVDIWETWSADDGERFKQGECESKWNSFGSYTGKRVTGATITQMAKERGWVPNRNKPDVALSFTTPIIANTDEFVIVDRNWVESSDINIPHTYTEEQRIADLTKYLETLFEPEDYVGYVTTTYTTTDKEGTIHHAPTKGSYTFTSSMLLSRLRSNSTFENAMGTLNEEAGAWIRFNPLDGQGVKNSNVTSYKYTLLESDKMDVGRQKAILEQLELPIAAMVYSGNKSIHAIVKVDAKNYDEYRTRVDFIYEIVKKNGFDLDKQNRNPSRLSRMPGAMRDGTPQFLMATNIGKDTYKEWFEWIQAVNDDLPEPEDLMELWDNMPELAPSLIDGILREGHKMLIAGPSKAGKSFALIQLSIALAEGTKWFGFDCTQGKVLYVNLELDRASCLHRFKDVYEAMGLAPNNLANISIWNLRGKSLPMDQLAPKLIRRAQKKGYKAIIIDPIYKVITGDENSADQMATFCNQFDKVCTELKCAVIYCHHHSKGSQSQKRSMDRASGSGVFARDPDALIDLLELELEDMKEEALEGVEFDTSKVTAWRMEGTLREFPRFKPVDLWFDYPIHKVDEGGFLAMAQFDSEQQKGGYKTGKKRAAIKENQKNKLVDAFNALSAFDANKQITVTELANYMQVSERTIRRYISESPVLNSNLGVVVKVNPDNTVS